MGAGSAGLSSMRGAAGQILPQLPPVVWMYVITVMTPVSFNLGPLAMTSTRLFLIVMIIPMFAKLLSGHYGKLFWTDYLYCLYVVWMMPVLLVNNPSQMIQQVGSVGLEFLGGYLIGRAYIRTPEAFLGLCKAMMIFVFFSVPFAIIELRTGNPIIVAFLEALPGLNSVTNVRTEGRMGMERVQNMFSHPIHYGLFCSVAFSLCMVALRDVISTPRRYFSAVIIAFAGFSALSSGAILAIALQMGFIIWAAMFAKVASRWKILVGIFAVAYVVIDLASNRQPIDVFMTYATFSPHTAYWRSIIFEWGMMTVWSAPVFGIGLHDWVRPWFMFDSSVDNFWLLTAMRFGIPGMMLVASGYVLGLFQIMRRDFSHDPVVLLIRRAWVFTFLGLSFTLCTVHVWTHIYSFVFFVYGAGMFLITYQPKTEGAAIPQDAQADGPTNRFAGNGAAPVFTRAEAAADSQAQARPVGPVQAAERAKGGAPYSRFSGPPQDQIGYHRPKGQTKR